MHACTHAAHTLHTACIATYVVLGSPVATALLFVNAMAAVSGSLSKVMGQ